MRAIERNNVHLGGRGARSMIFAHGFGCDQNMWRFVAPEFAGDYRTVLFDHVGAGKSHLGAYRSNKYGKLAGYATDVLEICGELGLRYTIFVGHSVSAMIGVIAANMEPRVIRELVLVCPSPCYVNDEGYVGGFTRTEIDELLDALEDNYLGWSSLMAPVIMGNQDRPELSAELANSFCSTDPAIAREFARVTFLSDHRADLPHVTARSLILQCADDVIAPRCVGEYTQRQIAGSKLAFMEATGHCPHLSAPAETVSIMKRFLSSDQWREGATRHGEPTDRHA